MIGYLLREVVIPCPLLARAPFIVFALLSSPVRRNQPSFFKNRSRSSRWRPKTSRSWPAGKSFRTATATTWWIWSASTTSPANVLLCVDEKDDTASALHGHHGSRKGQISWLWVRYEYPGFCEEARFKVVVQQGGKNVVERAEMAAATSPRFSFGELETQGPQYDQSWGSEGSEVEEVGGTCRNWRPARHVFIWKAVGQPQTPGGRGRPAHRPPVPDARPDRRLAGSIITSRTNLYPILELPGAIHQLALATRCASPIAATSRSTPRRHPRLQPHSVAASARASLPKAIAAGAASDWIPLKLQRHGSFQHGALHQRRPDVRPRSAAHRRRRGAQADRGESAATVPCRRTPARWRQAGCTPIEAPRRRVEGVERQTVLPGKKPTKPLCYGGWMPVGLENEYGHKYAELYAALGFRSLHPALSGPAVLKNLEAAGVPPTKSWSVSNYRNPLTRPNIAAAKTRPRPLRNEAGTCSGLSTVTRSPFRNGSASCSKTRWRGRRTWARRRRRRRPCISCGSTGSRRNRPDVRTGEYWLDQWGKYDGSKMRPDSSAVAAVNKPQLYVDSLIFYEETAIRHVAAGAKAMRAELGDDVLCGANYSCHPFYYPPTGMYVKWFRGGAADLGRHSEYFWQVCQAGPMINGYVAEHFRAGMRDNPRAVLRQYVMPHEPGNTDADFPRLVVLHAPGPRRDHDMSTSSARRHERRCFTENHIDFRVAYRYVALARRDALRRFQSRTCCRRRSRSRRRWRCWSATAPSAGTSPASPRTTRGRTLSGRTSAKRVSTPISTASVCGRP